MKPQKYAMEPPEYVIPASAFGIVVYTKERAVGFQYVPKPPLSVGRSFRALPRRPQMLQIRPASETRSEIQNGASTSVC